jgi:hypothetical protein
MEFCLGAIPFLSQATNHVFDTFGRASLWCPRSQTPLKTSCGIQRTLKGTNRKARISSDTVASNCSWSLRPCQKAPAANLGACGNPNFQSPTVPFLRTWPPGPSTPGSLALSLGNFWSANVATCKRGRYLSVSERKLTQSCRTTLRRDLLTRISRLLYSMKPRFLNLFMKKLTRERVVPIISARVSCDILATIVSGWSCLP